MPGHVRDILPRVRAGDDVMEALRLAAYRFDGTDTVSSIDRPIRIGIDFASSVDDGGILVAGWMLDPGRLVEEVTLRGDGGSVRLCADWTRQPRPDVTEAFAADPRFSRLDQRRNRHGFVAFAPGIGGSADGVPAYLELHLRDDKWPRYYPLQPMRSSARGVVDRLMPTLDPRSATAVNVIERQLGPMIQASQRIAPTAVEVLDIGDFDDEASAVLIVGADAACGDLGVLVALLALDPDVRSTPIVIAGPLDAVDEVAGDVRRLAEFYGLSVRLVMADGVEDFCDALEAGIAATRAETLVLLSAHIVPGSAGWMTELLAAHRRRGRQHVVSPALLFEDGSVCRSGMWLDDGPEGRKLVDHYVGFPAAGLTVAEPTDVVAGSIECCVLSREAFEASEGFAGGYVGTAEKTIDLALRLKLAGIASIWLPHLHMLLAESSSDAGQPWQRLARQVDAWSFERRWSLAISNMRG